MNTTLAGLLGMSALAFCLPPGWAASSPAESTNPPATAPQPADQRQLISAADPRFHYEGRFDFADTNAPVVIWQASRISLDFDGLALAWRFDQATGQNFFNAQVDGSNTVVEASEGKPVTPASLSGLAPGPHHLVLFKRSEATAGTVRFGGVELAAGAEARTPPPPAAKLRMEFIGDSITAGACNEDGPTDQWEDRRTHNAQFSYAALTAEAFQADYRNISVSGMGVVRGYVPVQAGEVWDRLYPATNSPRADLTTWQPQVVCLNFGENDESFSRLHGLPFPTNFTAHYVSLVLAIRSAHPAARIVLLRGGMFGGAQSEPLRKAFEATVAQLEAADPGVSHYVFKHWTNQHPRVADDRMMAEELTAFLHSMKPFGCRTKLFLLLKLRFFFA